MNRREALALAIGAPFVTLEGCTLLANPTFDAVLQSVIDVVVGALLGKNPAIASVVSADAAQLVMLVSGNATTTVAALEMQADTVIAASMLSTNDKAAMEALVAAAAGLLAQEASAIPANAASGLALVFTDIENAANLFPQQSASSRARLNAASPSSVLSNIDNAANLFGK